MKVDPRDAYVDHTVTYIGSVELRDLLRKSARVFLFALVLLAAAGCGNTRRGRAIAFDSGVPETDAMSSVDLGADPTDLGVEPVDLGVDPVDLGVDPVDLGVDLGPDPLDLGPPDLGPDLGSPDLGRDLGPPDLGRDLGTPGTIGVGALIVTELIANPALVSDTNGEWFEIYNTTSRAIDLLALVFRDDATNTFTVDVSLIVPAGGYAVLGRNADVSTNGGVAVDYVYPSSSFYIDNAGDEIVIERAGVVIDRVAYTTPTEGASWSLDPRYFDSVSNDSLANWCDALSSYGLGDRGTPGGANDYCF